MPRNWTSSRRVTAGWITLSTAEAEVLPCSNRPVGRPANTPRWRGRSMISRQWSKSCAIEALCSRTTTRRGSGPLTVSLTLLAITRPSADLANEQAWFRDSEGNLLSVGQALSTSSRRTVALKPQRVATNGPSLDACSIPVRPGRLKTVLGVNDAVTTLRARCSSARSNPVYEG